VTWAGDDRRIDPPEVADGDGQQEHDGQDQGELGDGLSADSRRPTVRGRGEHYSRASKPPIVHVRPCHSP